MPTKPRYRWNATTRRYFDTVTGRFVPETTVRGALDQAIAKANTEMRSLAEQLRRGDITAQEWASAMRAEIKTQQVAAQVAAKGGFAQMTAADYGRAGGQIAKQYKFLNNFVKQIGEGLPLDGRFIARTKLYAEAARATYEKTAGDVAGEAGATEEKNILHPADHCAECVLIAAQGWQEIGSLPAIGSRQCGNNCHCTMSYR